jgi:hypothetical protein
MKAPRLPFRRIVKVSGSNDVHARFLENFLARLYVCPL